MKRIPLHILVLIFGAIVLLMNTLTGQFVAGHFSPAGITDNYVLIGIFILAIIELLILLLVPNITEQRRNM